MKPQSEGDVLDDLVMGPGFSRHRIDQAADIFMANLAGFFGRQVIGYGLTLVLCRGLHQRIVNAMSLVANAVFRAQTMDCSIAGSGGVLGTSRALRFGSTRAQSWGQP